MAVYLDCNATTPIEPRVQKEVVRFLEEEFGNAGSRTHEYGARAKQAVERARSQVAAIVGAESDEVVFTSGRALQSGRYLRNSTPVTSRVVHAAPGPTPTRTPSIPVSISSIATL